MSFLENVEKARTFLARNGRVSNRALQREFDLDDDELDGLIEELVEIQQVAVRDGAALAWTSGAPRADEPQEPERETRNYTRKHLADKILQSRSAVEGELKRVTVLFADVKNSTKLAGALGPERWHGLLDRFFAILTKGVHGLEGTVNQYTGDGIMALFGAPIAHEDHAHRACYCALHLCEELRKFADEVRDDLGLEFGIRIGLNSGEVVVGKIGDDLRMDYTAQGDVVHLASRMEAMAEAGTVRLTENVARLVEGYFELRDLGPTAVRGVVEKVTVYELKGTGAFRTRLDLARARGLSHFVGRDDEAAVLEDALRDASEGRGRTVGIVGDPGVGKSRLCSEFVSLCRHRGLQVHEAHCVSHGRVLALGTILELLWGWFGLDRKEPSGNARAKISKRVKGAKRLEELLPTVFDFLGVPDPERPAPNIGPEGRHLQIKAFLGELLCHESEHEAVVLHLDDIHWIDPASDEFLRVIVEAASEARVLVLLNFRPEYPAEWMLGWEYQQISLAELEAEGADALLTDLLGAEVAGSALGDLLRDRASGNPFFLEEAVRSLLDSEHLEGAPGQYRLVVDLDEVEIPNTVQPLLASRIDRLREGEKEALQAAAIIGRTFQETLLQEASGIEAEELTTVLGNLERLGFLAETALYPEREYTFNHPLLHEVAARTQLEAQRQARHRAVARAIQVLHEGGDELAGFSPLIAHHCEQGGELLDAVRWHMRATDWLNNTDRRSALRHWQRIRQLASDLPHSGEVVPLALQACWHALVEFNIWIPMSDAEATSWSEEGISLAEQAGDLRMQGLLYGAFSYVKRSAGALPDQLAKAEEAVRLSDASGDPAAQVWSRSVLMTAQADLHLMPAAAQTGQDAVEIADRHPESAREPVMLQGRIYVSVLSAGVLPGLGRLSESLERLERLVGMARASGHQGFLHSALLFLGTSRIYGGDTEGAREAHDECWPLARSMGVWLEQEHYFYGQICLLEGNARDAVTHLEKAAELMTAGNFRATEAAMLSTLALAYAQADDPERAQEVANQTIKLATERRQFLDVGRAQRALALALLGQSGTAGAGAARQELDRALAQARQYECPPFEAQVMESYAELAEMLGDLQEQKNRLRDAHRLWTAMGAQGHVDRLGSEIAQLSTPA